MARRGFGLGKIIVLAAVAAAGYYAYGYFMHGGAPDGMMGGAPPVSVAEVIEREVQQWHEFSGRLTAVDSAQIRPQVSGIIEKIHFTEGESVAKGQPLFTIDQRSYLAALQSAQARATLAEADLGRAKLLFAEKAIPKRDMDQRQNAAEVARADLTRARLDYDYTVIKSPVTGRVGRPEITVGNLVDAGGNAPVLTTVVSDKPIYADFDIDEATYLNYLQAVGSDTAKIQGLPVFLALSNETNAPHEGRIQSFDNQLDVRSGTVRARAVFDNEDGGLIPGLYARVRIGSAAKDNALLITDRAVGTDQNRKFVIVVGEGGVTERREVKLGGMADGLRIVDSGLKPGEKIVVSGTQRVMMPGMPVTPEMVPMDAPAPAAGAAPAAAPEENKAAEAAPSEPPTLPAPAKE